MLSEEINLKSPSIQAGWGVGFSLTLSDMMMGKLRKVRRVRDKEQHW